MNLIFTLRALAARILLQERKKKRCRAAGKLAIQAGRSISETADSHSADFTDFRCRRLNDNNLQVALPLKGTKGGFRTYTAALSPCSREFDTQVITLGRSAG